jgi:hypothetical protein
MLVYIHQLVLFYYIIYKLLYKSFIDHDHPNNFKDF